MVTNSAKDGPIEESLLRAIVDEPADEGPRFAYADWLDERADPRSHCWNVVWKLGFRALIVI